MPIHRISVGYSVDVVNNMRWNIFDGAVVALVEIFAISRQSALSPGNIDFTRHANQLIHMSTLNIVCCLPVDSACGVGCIAV